jgi:hypothetical protein
MWTAEMEASRELAGRTELGKWIRQIGRTWYGGWIGFAAASGGRAEDLVGGSPWRSLSREGGPDAER